MSRLLSRSTVDPGSLPHVWRVQDLAAEQATLPTGHAMLDQALPGGGWPQASMVEVLQQRAGQHVWQLLLPGLRAALDQCNGPLVLVGAPYQPFGPSLGGQDFPAERLLCVHADQSAARLWAAEQALRCAQVAAVLAWVPQARSDELRRLHLAAQQHSRLLFVFRGWRCRDEASPAPLRLLLEGIDALEVHILKRRGPPLVKPLVLPGCCEKLTAVLEARRQRHTVPGSLQPASLAGGSHVLDRTAACAG